MKVATVRHEPLEQAERRLVQLHGRLAEVRARVQEFQAAASPLSKADAVAAVLADASAQITPTPVPYELAREVEVLEAAAAQVADEVNQERARHTQLLADANRAPFAAVQRKTAMALLALAAALQDEAEALADLRGAGVDVSTYPRSARRGVTLASLLRLSAEGEPAAKLVHDYLDSGALRPGDLPAEVRHELSKAVA